MSTGTIIAIAVGAVVVLLLITLVARAASRRREERRREQAGEFRQEARSRSIQAESARASADQQTAEARTWRKIFYADLSTLVRRVPG